MHPYGTAYGFAPAGANLQLDQSMRLSSELKAEEDFLAARRDLCANLSQAEKSEADAAQNLAICQQNHAVRTAEAQEQARRAAEAERIHAAAMEELRLREAHAQQLAYAAQEAKAMFDRAEAVFKQAEAARAQEVAAAQKAAETARSAEAQFAQSHNVEAGTASTLGHLQQTLSTLPAIAPGYGHAAYAGSYGYY